MNNNHALTLDRIVFIGRTYDEYVRMFDLDEALLRQGPVLDCAAGPSSFTAEAHESGVKATACDLLYDQPVHRLLKKSMSDVGLMYQKVADVPDLYVWKYYKDRDDISALRCKALGLFAADYPTGTRESRYVHAELPVLPFPDRSFFLVLLSHFLFLYGDRLSLDFHVSALMEMARVSSGEVRVYPLQGLDAKPYPHMEEVLSRLRRDGIRADIATTPFEFQRGANKMLRLFRGEGGA